MLASTRQTILEHIRADDLVLDIGGWADPFERADWVIDQSPYETRGYYERMGWRAPGDREPERFSADTWITRDLCEKERYPFDDDQFDVVICSHTLEDLYDPMWVCSEINRIGKAGYIEVPSRLEEQTWGVEGPYAGYAHHHWMVDVEGSHLDFVFKAHDLHASPDFYFPEAFLDQLSREDRVQRLWWEGSFTWADRSRVLPPERHAYFTEFVARQRAARSIPEHPPAPTHPQQALGPQRRGLRERLARLRR